MLWIVLIAILVGLVVASRSKAKKPLLLILLAITGFALAGWRAYHLLRPKPHMAYTTFSEAAGARLGEALVEAFPAGGDLLVIQHRGTEAADAIADSELKGLLAGLADAPFRIVPAGPQTGSGAGMERMEMVSVSVFRGWLSAHEGAVAAVSFLGVPFDTQARHLRNMPPLYTMFYGSYDHWLPLMQAGAVRGAIAPKEGAEWRDAPSRNMEFEAVLDLRYQYVSRETLGKYVDSISSEGR